MKITLTHSKCYKHMRGESHESLILATFLIFIFFSPLLLAAVNVSSNSTYIKGTLTERTGSTEEKTEQVKQMIMKITDKAAKSLENSTFTKEGALALEEEIKEALNSTQSKHNVKVVNLTCHNIQHSKMLPFSSCCHQKWLTL